MMDLGVDEIRISFLTPFPGTYLWQARNDALITKDYSDFTTFRPVIRHPNLNYEQLISVRKRLVKEYYYSSSYQYRVHQKTKRHMHLLPSFKEFFSHINKELNRNSNADEYSCLCEKLRPTQIKFVSTGSGCR